MTGTAIGNLGQHTGIQENGQPVFDHRLTVFEQVSSVLSIPSRMLKVCTDCFCHATYNNTDFRIHEVVRIAVL